MVLRSLLVLTTILHLNFQWADGNIMGILEDSHNEIRMEEVELSTYEIRKASPIRVVLGNSEKIALLHPPISGVSYQPVLEIFPKHYGLSLFNLLNLPPPCQYLA